MTEKIVQLNEEVIKGQIKEPVRGSVEETLNELLEAEANKLTKAARYERNEQRQGYRSDHYNRNLTTTSGNVTLKVSELKGISFETAIIERFRRQEISAEEAHIVSGRCIRPACGGHLQMHISSRRQKKLTTFFPLETFTTKQRYSSVLHIKVIYSSKPS